MNDETGDILLFGQVRKRIREAAGDKGYYKALAVYCHYIETAQRQRTNSIWATNEYVARGTGLGISAVKTAKQALINAGEIVKVKRPMRPGVNPNLRQEYIRITHLPKQKTVDDAVTRSRAVDIRPPEDGDNPGIDAAIKLYAELYAEYTGVSHPKITPIQLERVRESLDAFCTNEGVDPEDMVIAFWERVREGSIKTDGNINLFAEPGILEITFYEKVR